MSNTNLGNQIKIGERLREFRLQKDMKAIEFAKICEISQGSLSGLENGKSYPSAETLINLIRKTDIDIDWLLTGKKRVKVERNFKKSSNDGRNFEILDELEEWITSEIKDNPKKAIWFEIQLQELFPKFKAWKERKEGNAEKNEIVQFSKIA